MNVQVLENGVADSTHIECANAVRIAAADCQRSQDLSLRRVQLLRRVFQEYRAGECESGLSVEQILHPGKETSLHKLVQYWERDCRLRFVTQRRRECIQKA